MSYELYLWHSPVGWFKDARLCDWVPIMSRPVQFMVRVALILLIVWLSHRFVETPILRLKDGFQSRSTSS